MKIFSTIKKEQGVALIMVMVISAIVLVIMTAMIYMLTVGTRISGEAKRFTTATEAARGGIEIARSIVDRKDLLGSIETDLSDIGFAFGNETCAKIRIQNDVADWGACDDSHTIDIHNPDTYDYVFTLGDYKVYSKISYTIQGNSVGTGAEGWFQIGVVYSSGLGSHKGSSTGSGGEVMISHYEYLYNVEVDARNMKNPEERARLSMLYQY